jgi:hypothetical protein
MKQVQQKINLGGSSIDTTIQLQFVFAETPATMAVSCAQCVSVHSLGLLPMKYECRLYNLSLDSFPAFEEIDANDPSARFSTDKYLLYDLNAMKCQHTSSELCLCRK